METPAMSIRLVPPPRRRRASGTQRWVLSIAAFNDAPLSPGLRRNICSRSLTNRYGLRCWKGTTTNEEGNYGKEIERNIRDHR